MYNEIIVKAQGEEENVDSILPDITDHDCPPMNTDNHQGCWIGKLTSLNSKKQSMASAVEPSSEPDNVLPQGTGSENRNSDGSIVNATPPKKRKSTSTRRAQKYRKAWEFIPEFQRWLGPVEGNVYKAKCNVCCKELVADLSVLQSHDVANKHVKKCEELDCAQHTLDTLSSRNRGRQSEPVSREMFRKQQELSLPFESLAISDQLESGTFTPEGGYLDQPVLSVDLTGSQLAGTGGMTSGRTKPSDPPSYNSKAVVTKPAPPWKATAIVNGHVTRLELNDYKGRYLILFFYPQDFSAVCPTELLALSDRVQEFRGLQTEIVACSVDSHLTHLAWARTPRTEGGLGNPKIPLLADPTHSIARDYGVLLPDLGHSLRAHFIIDRRGILRHMLVNDLAVGRSIDELLRITQALQHVDETETGCPADWKPGLPSV